MKEYYAVLDITKIKTFSSLNGQERHNDRDYRMNHVDENQTFMNKNIIPTGGLTYSDKWHEIIRRKEAEQGFPIKTRKNSVIALDIVTAFSPGAEKALDINIDKWCEENRKFMEKTFGKENIIAMTLHMDETDDTPHGRRGAHIHTQIVPIDERGHLCAKSYTGGRMAMKKLHNAYGKAMKPFGLSRGEQNSKIKHEERKRWYATTAKLCQAQAPRIKDGESMDEYMDRLDTIFQDINIAAQKVVDSASRKVQHSQTRQAQIFGEYAYAVNLQHILEENFNGNEKKVNNRIKKYQTLEKCVPRKELEEEIDRLMEKYPPERSLNFWRKGKKKRHVKWEDPMFDNEEKNDESSGEDLMKLQRLLNIQEEPEVNDIKEVPVVDGKLGNVLGETLGE